MLRPILALLVTCALGVTSCGRSDEPAETRRARSQPQARTAPAAALPAGCQKVPTPRPRQERAVERPTGRLRKGRWTVQLRTNCGTIAIRLATDKAPRTAASFAALVRRGFYNGLTFHRIAGDPSTGPFVIQGGDPLGTGLGGPGFSVVERPPHDLRYTRGTVAMAKTLSEPAGASGSQFFIVTAIDAGLPPDYALVGWVSGGQDAVGRIASVPTGDDERPASPVVILQATLRGET